MYCICIDIIAVNLLFLPPSCSVDLDTATAADDAPVINYIVDDRTPTIELRGKQSHSPLPHIAYFSIIICCTRHMLLLRYFPIQMHSLSLSPFDVPFLYPIAAYIIYIILYSSGPCALLVIG